MFPEPDVPLAPDDGTLRRALANLRAAIAVAGGVPDDCRVTKVRYNRATGEVTAGVVVAGRCMAYSAAAPDVRVSLAEVTAALNAEAPGGVQGG